jgi:exodeoxyribonuclease V alpha subunit
MADTPSGTGAAQALATGAKAAVTTLEATVERVVFVNEENAWGVARIRSESRGPTSAVGRLFGIQPGERLRLTGSWEKDPKWGLQFRVESYLPLRPSTLEGIERYLGSGLVPGVGRVMAKRLVDRFGVETLDVIEHHPARLSQVEGIGPVRSRRIQEAWLEQRAVREVMIFLQGLGISPGYAGRIFRRWGQAAISEIKHNPYHLADEISGIGFETADRIAGALGIAPESAARLAAGALYVLAKAGDQGQVYLPRSLVVRRAAEVLDVAPDRVEGAVENLLSEQRLRSESLAGEREAALYLPALFEAEVHAAEGLGRLLAAEIPGPAIDVLRALRWFEGRSQLVLQGEQRRAVELALQEKALVITGGPGTGKTTLVRAIVEIFRRKRLRVLLAAPTGRAAKRLSEATGSEARTIHRLLEFDPRKGRFQRDLDHPLAADLVLIDEVSMVDTPLARRLIDALPDGVRLILVGDVDQLASVGPGKVLEELIRSRRLPVVRLQEVFRQAATSRIVSNAHRVNRGELPELDAEGAETDFFFIERPEAQAALETLLELVGRRVPRGFGIDPREEVQVLTPMRRGLLGADSLNRELQALLNPRGLAAGSLKGLCAGDRVMQLRNNYDLDVFNGDIGRVEAIDPEGRRLTVRFDERRVEYESAEIEQLALAYACSVHKAQGSEYPCVVMPLHGQHHVMLQRNLLYTAMTRASRLLVLVGDREALARAVRNNHEQRRFTALARRLAARTG